MYGLEPPVALLIVIAPVESPKQLTFVWEARVTVGQGTFVLGVAISKNAVAQAEFL